jgi:single-strand DNA-binding protein
MSGLNKVMLIGNLGKDPDVRYLETGVPVATFPLATTEVYRDREGNKVERTEWHNIVLWRGLAEVAKNHLRKGAKVFIEGKLSNRNWDDKEGNRRSITEIVGDNLLILVRTGDTLRTPTNYETHPAATLPPPTTTDTDNNGDTQHIEPLPF